MKQQVPYLEKIKQEGEVYFKQLAGEWGEEAFTAIYHLYYPFVYDRCRNAVKSRDRADVLSQDIFVSLWENRHLLEGVMNGHAYLIKMTAHAIVHFLRKKAVVIYQGTVVSPAITVTAESIVRQKELLAGLDRFIENLSSRQREIFILVKLQHQTPKQVAVLLQITQSAVYQHLENINEKLLLFIQFVTGNK